MSNHFLIVAFIYLPLLFGFSARGQDNVVNNSISANASASSLINEEKFISINGIQQWVTIKGDRSKPVILFLHGGPGSVMSPYADHIYKPWEKDFIIVQWDQRGAGRTYGHNAPEELTLNFLQSHPLTLELIAADGIALSQYLCEHLGKKKIILFGTSWGSALGITIVTKEPNLYYAYVGHSQIVNPSSDARLFDTVYQLARDNKDTISLNKLNEIGKPPYDRAKTVGQLWRIVKKYESENSEPAPASWFVEAPAYDNAKDREDRNNGDDYSFVNFVGDSQFGLSSIRASINFLEHNVHLNLPVYFIQGDEDILTPKESTKLYFDKLQAPEKSYILLPKTAHGFNQAVIDAQYKIFKSIQTQ